MSKSAEPTVQSAGHEVAETPVFSGRLSSVVSSADCRSAEQSDDKQGRVSEQIGVDGAAGIALSRCESAGHLFKRPDGTLDLEKIAADRAAHRSVRP